MQKSHGRRPWLGHKLLLQVSVQRTKYCREAQLYFNMHHHKMGPKMPHQTGDQQNFRAQPVAHWTLMPQDMSARYEL